MRAELRELNALGIENSIKILKSDFRQIIFYWAMQHGYLCLFENELLFRIMQCKPFQDRLVDVGTGTGPVIFEALLLSNNFSEFNFVPLFLPNKILATPNKLTLSLKVELQQLQLSE